MDERGNGTVFFDASDPLDLAMLSDPALTAAESAGVADSSAAESVDTLDGLRGRAWGRRPNPAG